MLQEHGLDAFVKPVGILTSHTGYFATTDAAYFVLMKLHNMKITIQNLWNINLTTQMKRINTKTIRIIW